MQVIRDWFRRHFSDPQVVILALVLLAGFLIVIFFGGMLAPVFASVVIAYLLEGLIQRLELWGVRRWLAVTVVFLTFVSVFLFLILGVVPPLTRQVSQLVQQLPDWIAQGRELLLQLPERYPQMITQEQVDSIMNELGSTLRVLGQKVVTQSLSSLGGVIYVLVFLVLVPVLVFFFLKDKRKILGWFSNYLPRDHDLVTQVWHEVDMQMGNFVRGKVLEILIVGLVTYMTFALLGLDYAILLATIVGFSVLIPYIGAAVATIPIVLVAFFQFGWSAELAWVVLAYAVIQALDGNALVPVLFSEVVNLHPVAIIVAVLIFGGIWGIWGVFFAIPLATLVNAVLRAWPKGPPSQPQAGETASGG